MGPSSEDPLDRGMLARLWLRALLLQASWNYERMQHLGFCFALLPLIRRLHGGEKSPERREALRRHLEFFNTHPVLAAAILGAVARLEAEGQGTAAHSCKLTLMGSYGAIGDSFFWGALRPAAGIIGVAVGLLWAVAGFPAGLSGAAAAGPLAALVLYNVPQLLLRAYGVTVGARIGIGVVEAIRRFRFPRLTARVRSFGAAALGFTTATLVPVGARLLAAPGGDAAGGPPGLPAVASAAGLLLAAVLGGFWLFARFGVVPTRLVWLLAGGALLAAAWL